MLCILFISLPYISITVVFLHFGQNTGKFLASVSFLIFVLVLLLHMGQYTQPSFTMFSPFLLIPTPILPYSRVIIVPTFCKVRYPLSLYQIILLFLSPLLYYILIDCFSFLWYNIEYRKGLLNDKKN